MKNIRKNVMYQVHVAARLRFSNHMDEGEEEHRDNTGLYRIPSS